MPTLTSIAKHVRVRGIVQGVGFRPYIFRLAKRHGVCGLVRNRHGDVEIAVEGDSDAVERFLHELPTNAPSAAEIDGFFVRESEPADNDDFIIADSTAGTNETMPTSPDIATCDDCLRELFDETDRRYRYPFINCTQCGPRFTISRSAPYDRERTSMADFAMCAACGREYDDPTNRRFHAQANACRKCGPRVELVQAAGVPTSDFRPSTSEIDPIRAAAAALYNGRIVAVKGLGGYHLAVDATNETTVAELRRRRFRERKPFAVMARDLAAVRNLGFPTIAEQRSLGSPRRPIVLLRHWDRSRVADSVCRGLPDLGVMLAYTPLHHLLLADVEELTGKPALLVMTSGNRSDEPIAHEESAVTRYLREIADHFLIHDRQIVHRCDDTVTRWICERESVVRRSRGDVPRPIAVAFDFPEPVLACGAQLKNTVCLGTGRRAMLSPHIGDLANYETLRSFKESIESLEAFARLSPNVLAHDLHPDYLSTTYALERHGIKAIGVQHHHAHIAGVLAEHQFDGPIIGVAFDGAGYGTDGHIWGGEFLIADRAEFRRAAHLEYIPLPGGEQAVRQPWRMAAVHLQCAFGDDFLDLDLPVTRRIDRAKWRPLQRMIERELNCPLTSSMGRLFDAVAAIVLQRDAVSFEGQAAMELEAVADNQVADGYNFPLAPGDSTAIDARNVVRGVVGDLQSGVSPAVVAGRFHRAVAGMIVAQCEALRRVHALNRVALSGGVFQNRLLIEMTFTGLKAAGFEAFTNNRIPANDGGIAFGQAAVAAARLER